MLILKVVMQTLKRLHVLKMLSGKQINFYLADHVLLILTFYLLIPTKVLDLRHNQLL